MHILKLPSNYRSVRILSLIWIQILIKHDLQIFFSKCMVCLFIFLMVSFEEEKFQILLNCNLSVFSFMNHDFGVKIMEFFCQTKGHKSFFLYVFFEKFYSLNSTLKPMVHWKLIFVSSVRYGSKFIYLHMYIQLYQHYLLKKLSFL